MLQGSHANIDTHHIWDKSWLKVKAHLLKTLRISHDRRPSFHKQHISFAMLVLSQLSVC